MQTVHVEQLEGILVLPWPDFDTTWLPRPVSKSNPSVYCPNDGERLIGTAVYLESIFGLGWCPVCFGEVLLYLGKFIYADSRLLG